MLERASAFARRGKIWLIEATGRPASADNEKSAPARGYPEARQGLSETRERMTESDGRGRIGRATSLDAAPI